LAPDEIELQENRRRYATLFLSNVLGRADVVIKPDLVDCVADALARTEELDNPNRDEWGNWEDKFSERAAAGKEPGPWLDEQILRSVDAMAPLDRPEPRWPEGRRFALCLTHDVDGVSSRNHGRRFLRRLSRVVRASGPKQFAAFQALGSLYRLASGIAQPDRLGRFEEWTKLEASHGFRSTWYFLPSDYKRVHVYDMDYTYDDVVTFAGSEMRVSRMMKAIHEAGGEIGLHGSYLSASDATLLANQRRQVEGAVGQPVRSIRQHYLRYDARHTPAAQAKAGFQSDSTQGFNTTIGCRAGTCFPYRVWDHETDSATDVLEIPMNIMDVALLRISSGNAEKALTRAIEFMDRVAELGGCLTLNWHPNLIDRQPFLKMYEVLLQEAAARKAWGCSAIELTDWWNARERRINRVVPA